MGNIVPNIAKGRWAELYNRVKLGDPAAARLYVIPISAGAVSDATLLDCDDFAAMVTAGIPVRADVRSAAHGVRRTGPVDRRRGEPVAL
jgi:hypothetical protein